jgi:hypothetical protein
MGELELPVEVCTLPVVVLWGLRGENDDGEVEGGLWDITYSACRSEIVSQPSALHYKGFWAIYKCNSMREVNN